MNHQSQKYSEHLKRGILSPPLPLVKFSASRKENETIKTLTGEEILSIPNNLDPTKKVQNVKLSDPMFTKRLSKWFVARSQKEVNFRQMENYNKLFSGNNLDQSYPEFFEYTIYESLLHIENKSERLERKNKLENEELIFQYRSNKNSGDFNLDSSNHGIRSNSSFTSLNSGNCIDSIENVVQSGRKNSESKSPFIMHSSSLIFDAEFESGNLEKATRVIGREAFSSPKNFELISDYEVPQEIDQEYDLTLRNDLNTDGNIQWYYFSVSTSPDRQYNFPLKVRFNINNMQKKDSLYNYGMKPAFFSKENSVDWTHAGEDVCYFKNGSTVFKERKKKVMAQNMYTLTFTYTFNGPDTVFFAHSYPYTYSDLVRYLNKLENTPSCSSILFRRTLCETLAGNKCEILTITERAEGSIESKSKPSILITGRVHPGETNSSYIMQGIIDFLCSESLEAEKLRKVFIFSIIPMMNPDGVIHGNYRCSLAGTDLNRRFSDAHPNLHPTIVALKDLVHNITKNRPILLYLDIHGHSKQKNSFLYGCDLTYQPEKYLSQVYETLSEEEINKQRIHCRIFPKILCSISKSLSSNGYFSYKDCAFSIDKTKFGTGRVVCWKDYSILGSYTIEASFCSNGDNSEKRLLKKYFDQLSNQNINNPSMLTSSNLYSQRTAYDNPRLSNFSRRPVTAPQQRTMISPPQAFNSVGLNLNKGEEEEEVEDLDILDENDDGNSDIMDDDQEQINSEEEKIDNFIEQNLKKKNFRTQIDSCSKQPPIPDKKINSNIKKDPDLDPALADILSSYKNLYHYQKSNLLNMGKHIALAIFHYSNLTHSDLEYEKEVMLQSQLDKNRRNGIFHGSMAESTAKCLDIDFSGKVGMKPPRSTLASILVNNLKAQQPLNQNSIQSNLSGGFSGLSLNIPSNDVNDIETGIDDLYSDSTPKSSMSLNDLTSSKSSNIEFISRYRTVNSTLQPLRVDSIEETMSTRLLLKPSVFSISAIQNLLQSYGSEVLIEKSSINLGLRIKCELAVRHLLKLDEKIKYEKYNINFDSIHNSWVEQSDEEESAGGGSESEPSVDNKQASNFLKNMKKYKDSNALVNALRSIAKKKRAKELELQEKKEKKLLKKIALENEMALKLKAEQEALEKGKKDKQDKLSFSEKPLRPSRPQSASNYRPSRQSIYNSVPKHTPVYRLAPSSDVKINIPVQIKIVNFKDFDKSRTHRHHHSQLFSNFVNEPNGTKNSNPTSAPQLVSTSRMESESNSRKIAFLPPALSIPPNPVAQSNNLASSNYDNIISLVSGNLTSPTASTPKFKKSIAINSAKL